MVGWAGLMRWWRAGMRRQMWLYAAVCLAAAAAVLTLAQLVASEARATARELSSALLPAGSHIEALNVAYGAQRSTLFDYVWGEGESVSLAKYREATEKAPAAEADVAGIVAAHPQARAAFEQMRAAQANWVRGAAEPELAAAAGGDWVGAQEIYREQGVALSREVSKEASELRGELQKVQSNAVDQVLHELRLLLGALFGCLVLIISMVVGTYVALRRNVLTPFLSIGRAVDRVAAGEHQLSIPESGPLELAALGHSVEAMRVRMLAALSERQTAELRFRQLLERSPDATVQLAEDGLIVSINARAERLFGYPREELEGRPMEVLVPSGLREQQQAHLASSPGELVRTAGESLALSAVHADGRQLPVEVTLSAIRTEQGPLVSAAMRDVSERLAAQAERERLIAEAEQERFERRLAQSQRLESLGQLVGGVAHDFNNLLNIILGYSNFVTEALQEPPSSGTWEATREDVEQIHDAAERASRLTHQLLAFGRREVIKPEVVSLNDVVTGLEQLLRRTLGEHIELATSLDPELWMVKADPGQLEQVLVNLAVNARDAMAGGGRLTIDTSNVDVDPAFANSRPGMAPGRYARLRVSDTGTGMAKETMRRVFEPFFTTKPKGQGTGLGLATVYGIVTQARGHPQLYSEVGLGTTFSVAAAGHRRAGGVRGADAGAGPRRPHGETVLLVEDEEPLRELVARILSQGDYQVLIADNARARPGAGRRPRPADRPAAHRRGDARDARQGGGRAGQPAAAGPAGAVHVRVRARGAALPGHPRPGGRAAGEAVHPAGPALPAAHGARAHRLIRYAAQASTGAGRPSR